jgi:predicted SAM-dependent methyltransferase
MFHAALAQLVSECITCAGLMIAGSSCVMRRQLLRCIAARAPGLARSRLERRRRSGYDGNTPAARDQGAKTARWPVPHVLLMGGKLKLLIGSRTRYPGWKTLDLVGGPQVDYVGDCETLEQFDTGSIEELYASHVLEHVPYAHLPATLKEWHRVLMPGGKIMVAVPDMNILAQLFVKPDVIGGDKVFVMRMMFGGQLDDTDFHCIGFDLEILGVHLHMAGFEDIRRVSSFGLFQDTSIQEFYGIPISLNVEARKKASD